MNDKIVPPKRKISKDGINVWRITNLIGHSVTLIILAILLYLDIYFSWKNWIGTGLWIMIAIIGLSAIWSIFLEPVFLQRNWRYDIDEQFVKLKHGAWNETNIVIPMTKVQYVTTQDEPLFRKYGLMTLEIGTMATTHEIPILPRKVGLELRDKIAHFAKIKDEE